MESRPHIDAVWQRICRNEGETFHQKRGGEFTYSVISGALVPNRTNQQIPRSQFADALKLVPLFGTKSIHHLRGPSYIYAVLMDPRIKGEDW
jgi:hypothetical protein